MLELGIFSSWRRGKPSVCPILLTIIGVLIQTYLNCGYSSINDVAILCYRHHSKHPVGVTSTVPLVENARQHPDTRPGSGPEK